MCNLYSITTNQAAIAGLFRRMNRYVGNLASMPGVFPDYPTPVIRNIGDAEEMVLMRWGMPPPPKTGGPPVTNIRNTSSPHLRGWLKPENRCLFPANSFAEYAPEANPETKKKDVVWFALEEGRPLFASPTSGPSSGATVAPSRSRFHQASARKGPSQEKIATVMLVSVQLD
jgi:putative SOS response-associated peptidase YedK